MTEQSLRPESVRYLFQRMGELFVRCDNTDAGILTAMASNIPAEEKAWVDTHFPDGSEPGSKPFAIEPTALAMGNAPVIARWPQEIKGEASRTPDFSNGLSINVPALSTEGGPGTFLLKDLQYRAQAQCQPDTPQRQQHRFASGEVTMVTSSGPKKGSTSLKNPLLDIDTRREGDFGDVRGRFALDALNTTEFALGIGRVELVFDVRHVYLPALQKINWLETAATAEQDKGAKDKKTPSSSWSAALLEAAERNASINLDRFFFQTLDKGLTLDGKVYVAKLERADIAQPARLLQKMDGKLRIKVTRPMLRQYVLWQARQKIKEELGDDYKTTSAKERKELDQLATKLMDKQIKKLTQQGIVVVEKNMISTEATLSQGKLVINGKPFPLPNFN